MSNIRLDEVDLSASHSTQHASDDMHTVAALFSEKFQLLCDPQRIVVYALKIQQQPEPVEPAEVAAAPVAVASVDETESEDGEGYDQKSAEDRADEQEQQQEESKQQQKEQDQQQQQQPRQNGDVSRSEVSAQPLPGLVFIIGAIEKLLATKEGKKRDASTALEKALQALKPFLQPQTAENNWLSRSAVDVVLDALDMLCVAQASALTLAVVLDCIEKLVSFHYFDNVVGLPTRETVAQRLRSNYQSSTSKVARTIDESAIEREATIEAQQLYAGFFRSVADRLVGMVTRCFVGEATADQVQLQIVRALFALLSSDRLPVRQSSMLATIRTAYNVFVQTRSLANQTIAQGTLTQMVHLVLGRVPVEKDDDSAVDEDAASADANGNIDSSAASDDGGAHVENDGTLQQQQQQVQQQPPPDDSAARDAFLLLRALCKLSMRQIPNDHTADGKSPQLRARCLALNLIRLALAEHTPIFTSSYV
ncbi:guanine nucleotide exchange protein for ADP-robosylation factor, partial [Coemansia sp. RSA 1939]